MIKYGLYISKKATAFLEKIANGEQINNLNGYFAQFDGYIEKLKELENQPTTNTTTPEQTQAEIPTVSATPPPANDNKTPPTDPTPAPQQPTF